MFVTFVAFALAAVLAQDPDASRFAEKYFALRIGMLLS